MVVMGKERLQHGQLRRTRILILVEQHNFEFFPLALTNFGNSDSKFGS